MKSKIYLFLFLVFTGVTGISGLDAQPFFTGGSPQFLPVCQNSSATSINGLLAYMDTSTVDTLTWSAVSGPSNGTLNASYMAIANGGIITPSGLTYTPNSGYNGPDSFMVVVTDGSAGDTDTTVIYVMVNPLPNVYMATGGGVYCQGGSGVDISLSNSDLSTTYQLYNDGVGGTTISGTGSALDFGNQTDSGLYSIVATGTGGCMAIMEDSAVVMVSPVPAPISGTTTVCAGAITALADTTAAGVWSSSDTTLATVGATGIVTGVSAGSPVIDYTLVATGCLVSTTVTVNPLPNIYDMTGGGSYCAGASTAYNIGLTNSDIGFSYQLYNGTIPIGIPSSGTGSALNFGATSVPGIYTVISTNTSTLCMVNMADSAAIISNPLPVIDTVTGGGSYCSGSGGAPIGLNSSTSGVSYQLYHNSLTVGSPVTGTGSAITFGGFSDTTGSYMAYAMDITTGCADTMAGSVTASILPLPLVYSITGGGSYCAGGTGLPIGLSSSQPGITYRLYYGTTVQDTMSGTGSGAISFGPQTLEGAYSVTGVDATTGCTNNMTGSAAIIINPLPAVYTAMGGGYYCSGGAGVDISLSASNTGILYQLYNGGALVTVLSGTGSFLDLGLQTGAGVYTVVASDAVTSCTDTMSGSPVITINPLPNIYTVTGGGSYCAGGAGDSVGLDLSQAGISYKLYNGATLVDSIAGTGVAISFGLQTTSGSYTALATDTATGCNTNMSGSVPVAVIPAPASHSVTGGGGYCAGGTGVAIGLNGSDAGVDYQLYIGTSLADTTMNGTGIPLNFGSDTAAGVYTVIATDTTTHCTALMNGNATVTINPLLTPMVSINMSTADTICAGTAVTFSATPVDGGITPTYQWMVNGFTVGTGASYSYGPSNGDVIGVELTSSEGCVTADTAMDSINIAVWPNGTPAVTIMADNDTVCKGSPVTFTVADTFQGPSPSYVWQVNGVSSGSGSIFTYTPHNGDIVYAGLVSDYLCRLTTLVASNNVALTVDSPIAPIVEVIANPGTEVSKEERVTFTAVVADGGSSPLYQWYVGSLPVLDSTSASVHLTFGAIGHDSVTCMVTRTDACRLSSYNGVIVMVNDLGVSNLNSNDNIAMYPNPNNGTFTIKGTTGVMTDETVSVEITDMLGQSVYESNIISANGIINQQISVSTLAAGSYLLNVHYASENTILHFVIEK